MLRAQIARRALLRLDPEIQHLTVRLARAAYSATARERPHVERLARASLVAFLREYGGGDDPPCLRDLSVREMHRLAA